MEIACAHRKKIASLSDRPINGSMKSTGRKTVKAATTSAPKAARSSGHATRHATTKAPSTTDDETTTDAAPPPAASAPAFEDIARRSYAIYLARGAEDGHDVEDWIQAEQELGARR